MSFTAPLEPAPKRSASDGTIHESRNRDNRSSTTIIHEDEMIAPIATSKPMSTSGGSNSTSPPNPLGVEVSPFGRPPAALTQSAPQHANMGASIMARRTHRKNQGSLAPVLERLSNSESPGLSRRSGSISIEGGAPMAGGLAQGPAPGLPGTPSMMTASMTPNTRRLINSPGVWLKQAMNPNAVDPAYIQSFKKHKVKREFNHVHLLQESQAHTGSVWTAEVSPDGAWFLTGGKDLKLMLYRIAPPEDGSNSILHHECTYEGHQGDVLCVSWAKNSEMFVSSSMDRTVRLWKLPKGRRGHTVPLGQYHQAQRGTEGQVQREAQVFEHADFVTSVAFHPNNEWFVSGCFDKKLRVWSIREQSVLFWVDMASFITSVALASEGRMVICGDHEGKATFFDTEGLRWITQIHVRSRRGRNSKGKKISGIRVMPDQETFLVTSNDSRIRLFRLSDFGLICKYKGFQNDSFQIIANPSESGEHIICGSESNNVIIWNTHKRNEGLSFSLARQKFTERKDRNRSFEFWRCSDGAVTVALFLPAAARSRLSSLYATAGESAEGGEPDTTFVVTCDETGKLQVFENRKRLRRHAAALLRGRGSQRDLTPRMTPKTMQASGAFGGSSPQLVPPPPINMMTPEQTPVSGPNSRASSRSSEDGSPSRFGSTPPPQDAVKPFRPHSSGPGGTADPRKPAGSSSLQTRAQIRNSLGKLPPLIVDDNKKNKEEEESSDLSL